MRLTADHDALDVANKVCTVRIQHVYATDIFDIDWIHLNIQVVFVALFTPSPVHVLCILCIMRFTCASFGLSELKVGPKRPYSFQSFYIFTRRAVAQCQCVRSQDIDQIKPKIPKNKITSPGNKIQDNEEREYTGCVMF